MPPHGLVFLCCPISPKATPRRIKSHLPLSSLGRVTKQSPCSFRDFERADDLQERVSGFHEWHRLVFSAFLGKNQSSSLVRYVSRPSKTTSVCSENGNNSDAGLPAPAPLSELLTIMLASQQGLIHISIRTRKDLG
jgi:hypothetical protein